MKPHHDMDREPLRRVPAADYSNWIMKVIIFAAWIALLCIVIVQICEGSLPND